MPGASHHRRPFSNRSAFRTWGSSDRALPPTAGLTLNGADAVDRLTPPAGAAHFTRQAYRKHGNTRARIGNAGGLGREPSVRTRRSIRSFSCNDAAALAVMAIPPRGHACP